ncbi:MAG TPA: hypothetical protein VFP17_00695, partial [Solirubrobacterales bacterium]|nr:hypothetical protein [Solirubrobacterales bacterium]
RSSLYESGRFDLKAELFKALARSLPSVFLPYATMEIKARRAANLPPNTCPVRLAQRLTGFELLQAAYHDARY